MYLLLNRFKIPQKMRNNLSNLQKMLIVGVVERLNPWDSSRECRCCWSDKRHAIQFLIQFINYSLFLFQLHLQYLGNVYFLFILRQLLHGLVEDDGADLIVLKWMDFYHEVESLGLDNADAVSMRAILIKGSIGIRNGGLFKELDDFRQEMHEVDRQVLLSESQFRIFKDLAAVFAFDHIHEDYLLPLLMRKMHNLLVYPNILSLPLLIPYLLLLLLRLQQLLQSGVTMIDLLEADVDEVRLDEVSLYLIDIAGGIVEWFYQAF